MSKKMKAIIQLGCFYSFVTVGHGFVVVSSRRPTRLRPSSSETHFLSFRRPSPSGTVLVRQQQIQRQQHVSTTLQSFFGDNNDQGDDESSILSSWFNQEQKETTTTTTSSTTSQNVIKDVDLASEISTVLEPFASVLNESTNGWALTYADLRPETHTTPTGMVFLTTNLAYSLAGILLSFNGDVVLGGLTELCSVISFVYHYCQLKLGPEQQVVRLAMMVDYIFACSTIVLGLIYMANVGIAHIPLEGFESGALAILCLGLCWVWERGLPYIFWHSLWHIFSAYTGFIVGQAHIIMTTTTMQ